MKSTPPLGCLSGTGIIAAIVTALILVGVGLASGGRMFSPGSLNAQSQSGALLGDVANHAETGGDCGVCHAAPWASDTMSVRCLACHTDVQTQLRNPGTIHEEMQSANCRDCHVEHNGPDAGLTRLAFDEFPHEKVGFSLAKHMTRTGGAAFTCQDCHVNDLATFSLIVCADCHGELGAAFMVQHASDFGEDCLACHDGVDRMANFDHSQTNFLLVGEHSEPRCAECHTNGIFEGASSDCYACHEQDDKHDGKFGADCAACHSPKYDWERVTFDHNQTDFPLKDKHLTTECTECHVDGVFAGAPTDCFGCHEKDDEHNGEFGADCASCHIPSGWDRVTFDHDQTNFPLVGEHREPRCTECHVDGVFAGTPTECFACHEQDDKHNGEFGTDCAACHSPRGDWDEVDFDHNLTDFPLDGAHISVACEQCHAEQVFADTSAVCESCHAEPEAHLGQFGTDCAACHTTTAWTPATLEDHTFPLKHESRETIECRVCHPDTYTAYTCYGCHEHSISNVEREHREEGIREFTNCVECHPTGREEEGDGREREDDD